MNAFLEFVQIIYVDAKIPKNALFLIFRIVKIMNASIFNKIMESTAH
jgi:hypothetical protein